MKIVISEQPVEIHPVRHMRGYIQIMQQRGTTVNYSANTRSGFLFPTSVYTGKAKNKKLIKKKGRKSRNAPGEYVNLSRAFALAQPPTVRANSRLIYFEIKIVRIRGMEYARGAGDSSAAVLRPRKKNEKAGRGEKCDE